MDNNDNTYARNSVASALSYGTGQWEQDEYGDWYEVYHVPTAGDVDAALALRQERAAARQHEFFAAGMTRQAKYLADWFASPFVSIKVVAETEGEVTFIRQAGWWGLEPHTITVRLAVWQAALAANRNWRYDWWNS